MGMVLREVESINEHNRRVDTDNNSPDRSFDDSATDDNVDDNNYPDSFSQLFI